MSAEEIVNALKDVIDDEDTTTPFLMCFGHENNDIIPYVTIRMAAYGDDNEFRKKYSEASMLFAQGFSANLLCVPVDEGHLLLTDIRGRAATWLAPPGDVPVEPIDPDQVPAEILGPFEVYGWSRTGYYPDPVLVSALVCTLTTRGHKAEVLDNFYDKFGR